MPTGPAGRDFTRGTRARREAATDNQTTGANVTPLHALHLSLGARMVPFAGYDMPVQYPPGILKEHLHTRAAAGLFDVSHMGQIVLRPRSGKLADAAANAVTASMSVQESVVALRALIAACVRIQA